MLKVFLVYVKVFFGFIYIYTKNSFMENFIFVQCFEGVFSGIPFWYFENCYL